jgi:hypothetical protein
MENKMKIQNRDIDINKDYLSPITYIPNHANDNPNHPDAEKGVIIKRSDKYVFMLNCKSRTVQAIDPINLIWG